jgi:hypothetical protein
VFASSWIDRFGQALAYAPALAAVLVLLGALRAWYRRTLGRRRDKTERLRRLGANAHVTFFTAVLGEPPAMQRTLTGTVRVFPEGADDFLEERPFLESIWIDPDFYVQTLADHDGAVAAFSVTTRHRRFHPKLVSPGGEVEERGWLMRWFGRLPVARRFAERVRRCSR